MRVVETVRELHQASTAERAAGRRVALVPTMGALHAGHVSLVEIARRHADRVWLSIFVNPTQFGPNEDLARYPRPRERDLALCREAGVELVFAPTVEEMYPHGSQTFVELTELSRPLCGRARPGHFRGVATVVTKLLAAARPQVAVFGEKDFQQLALIRRLAKDLLLDVEIVGGPIVREPDGLALSSRNVHLDAEARAQATALPRALDAAERAVAAGERDGATILGVVRAELAKASRGEVDYAELCDPGTLAPAPARLSGPTLLALAVRFAPAAGAGGPGVRLIDNRLLLATTSSKEAS